METFSWNIDGTTYTGKTFREGLPGVNHIRLDIEDFRTFISSFNPLNILKYISCFDRGLFHKRYSGHYLFDHADYELVFSPYYLALLSKYALMFANTTSSIVFSQNDFIRSIDFILRFEQDEMGKLHHNSSDLRDAQPYYSALLNKAHFYPPSNIDPDIYRYLHLFMLINPKIDEMICDILGKPLDYTYMRLLKIFLNLPLDFKGEIVISNEDPLTRAFLETLAVNYSHFGDVLYEEEDNPYSPLSVTSLEAAPIIKHNCSLFAPVLSIAISKCTSGLYYPLIKKYGNDFAKLLGDAFHKYIGKLLAMTHAKNDIINLDSKEWEHDFGRKADFAVISKRICIIIECKSKRMPKSFKETGEKTKGYTKAIDEYVVGLGQCEETQKVLCKKQHLGIKKWYYLVITLDQFRGENNADMRRDIQAKLAVSYPYQIMSSVEFEKYSNLIKKHKLPKLMVEKCKPESYKQMFEQYFLEKSINTGMEEVMLKSMLDKILEFRDI